jgi:hypothetical protein
MLLVFIRFSIRLWSGKILLLTNFYVASIVEFFKGFVNEIDFYLLSVVFGKNGLTFCPFYIELRLFKGLIMEYLNF